MTTLPGMSASTRELVTIVRRDGRIEYQSPTVNEALGYTPGDLRDEDFFSYVHPDDHDHVQDVLEELSGNSGLRMQGVEYRFRRKGRSWAWIESLGTRWENMIVLNSRDITEQKEKRQQATVLHRILRHNLRNRLNVIMMRAETLTEDEYPEQVRQNAEEIVRCVSRLDELAENTQVIENFFDDAEVHREPQDLIQMLSEIVEEFRDQHPNVEFDVALGSTQRVPVSPDLDIAVRHVLENAIQHNNAENPRVQLGVSSGSTDPDELRVAIADNGPGIPEEERAVLIEGEETPLQHGSGTGLWIINWIVSHCGGRIEFEESRLGGSRVTLIFPVL